MFLHLFDDVGYQSRYLEDNPIRLDIWTVKEYEAELTSSNFSGLGMKTAVTLISDILTCWVVSG